jgi:hypothetical protein
MANQAESDQHEGKPVTINPDPGDFSGSPGRHNRRARRAKNWIQFLHIFRTKK